MVFHKIFIWVFCCFFVSNVSGQYEKFLHTDYVGRAKAFGDFWEKKTTNENYDSTLFFNEVLAMREFAVRHNDPAFEMDTYMCELSFFLYRKKYSPKDGYNALKKTLKIAHDRKLLNEASVEKHFGAFYFYRVMNYELAFEHYLRMYEIIKDVSLFDFPDKINCINQLAYAYYHFKDYKKTIFYAKNALDCERQNKSNNFLTTNFLLIGKCFTSLNHPDSADYYFNASLKNAITKKDTFWTGIASGNLGYSYFLNQQYEKAIPFLKKDIESPRTKHDWTLAVEPRTILAAIALKRNNIAEAEALLAEARKKIIPKRHPEHYLLLYSTLTKLYMLKDQDDLATIYFDSTNFLQDSLARQFNALKMVQANQDAEHKLYQSKIDAINHQKSRQMLIRNILLVVIFSAMIVNLLLFSRMQLKQKNKQQKLMLEKMLAEQELTTAKEQMHAFTKSIQEKNDLIARAYQEIEYINATKPSDSPASEQAMAYKQASLKTLQESVILTENNWRNFIELFEKVYSGFLSRLKDKIPAISAAETRFLCLVKIQLNTKEMASMLGISTDAIRQMRSRLKRKLNLTEDENLETLVENI